MIVEGRIDSIRRCLDRAKKYAENRIDIRTLEATGILRFPSRPSHGRSGRGDTDGAPSPSFLEGASVPLALYIHVPFCTGRCTYCYFVSSGDHDLAKRENYVSALCNQIERFGSRLMNARATSLYIGGGTPTCLSSCLLRRLILTVRRCFELTDEAEVTVETSPETTQRGLLDSLRAVGVNRLSIGVQSFHDDTLRLMGRRHSAREAEAAIRNAFDSGFENINIDLIAAFPLQAPGLFLESMYKAIQLQVPSITVYPLDTRQRIPLQRHYAAAFPSRLESLVEEVGYRLLLKQHSYSEYLIKWFRRNPNARFLYQEHKWACRDTLGMGVSAYGQIGGYVYALESDTLRFCERVLGDEPMPLAWAKQLSSVDFLFRRFYFGLRLPHGLALSEGELCVFNSDAFADVRSKLQLLIKYGLVRRRRNTFSFTRKGRLFSEEIPVYLAPREAALGVAVEAFLHPKIREANETEDT